MSPHSKSEGVEQVIASLRSGSLEVTAEALEALLAEQWRSPEVCHLAGSVWMWQAIDATERGDLAKAADCWEAAVPHLVAALGAGPYLGRFAALRGATYGEELEPGEITDGVRLAVGFAEARLKELAGRADEARDERLAQRLRLLQLQWRLEWEAAARVRRLGGVPDGQTPARCMVLGPGFAARYGLTELVRKYLERLEIPVSSDFDQFLAQIIGAESELAGVQRDALYCFSELAMPFVYHLADQHNIALATLKAVAATAATDGAAAPVGAALEARTGARELAIRIHFGLGAEELNRVQCDPDIVFEHFQAAHNEAQLREGSAPNVASPARQLRRKIATQISARLGQLAEFKDWDRAVRLAKVLAKLDPTRDRVRQIVSLLKRQAEWHAERDETDGAIDCMQRAHMLDPEDQQVLEYLLLFYGKRMHDLAEAEQHLEAAKCCMEILDEVRAIEKNSRDGARVGPTLKELTERAKSHAAAVLFHAVQSLGDGADPNWVGQAHAYVFDAVRGGLEHMETAGATRLANQAIELANQEQWAAAYASVDKAFTTLPDEPQIELLYENISAVAIARLCRAGEVDRADEIAERASERLPQSKTIQRARARITLRRLNVVKLTSSDPEEIAELVTTIESRIDESADMDEAKARGGRYAAIIDADLRIEQHLDNVVHLTYTGYAGEALSLLDEETYSGQDVARADYCRCTALRFCGKPDEALEVIERVLEKNPLVPMLLMERARTLSQCGRFDEAEDVLVTFREAEEVDASASSATGELGLNAWRAGRDEDAVAQMRLARAGAQFRLEGIWVECMALKRLGRDHEVAEVLEAGSKIADLSPWESTVLRWLAGEASDETLASAPVTRVERLEMNYWLGEKLRMRGDGLRGRTLIRRCLENRSLGYQHEFQHAQALVLSGQV